MIREDASKQPVLYTIGYEGLTLDKFTSFLAGKVRAVADVRNVAWSRKPGFCFVDLNETLPEHGILYKHFPLLGCRKNEREDIIRATDWAKFSSACTRYLQGLKKQEKALAELDQFILENSPVALMCFEKDFNHCHRTLLANEIVSRLKTKIPGLVVEHLNSETDTGEQTLL